MPPVDTNILVLIGCVVLGGVIGMLAHAALDHIKEGPMK